MLSRVRYNVITDLCLKISQYYYPAIAPIVLETCAKHDIRYNLQGTLYQALVLHVGRLVSMGTDPSKLPLLGSN
jgi:hypothetical protein